MGKKSLTQSTTGKKSSGNKKKNAPKKTVGAQSKNTKTKSQGSKKTSRKPSLKSLRKKKFDTWTPEKPYVAKPAPGADKNFAAPALTDDYDAEAAEKIRTLLFKQFDLSTPEPAKEQEPAPAEPARKETGKESEPEAAAEKEEKTEPGAAAEKEKEQASGKQEAPEAKEPSDSGGASGGGGDEPPGGPPEPPESPKGEKRDFPLSRELMLAIGGFALIFILIIGASINNMGNYYIRQSGNSLEILRGSFSPRGKTTVATLPGAEAQATLKDQYSRQEALNIAFKYYMQRAGDLTESEGVPDFKAIEKHLNRAKHYAASDKQRKQAARRIDRLEFVTLMYKADVAAEKQNRQGLETALDYLEQASALNLGPEDKEAVKQRISNIGNLLEELEKKQQSSSGDQAGKATQEGKKNKSPEPDTASP